jgi:predicted amino acid dehydrogenase
VLFLALALCFFIGALPVGYWLTRLTGLDPRRTSAHNVGLENTARLQGGFLTGLVFGLDLLKGVLAVTLMQGFANQAELSTGVLAGALLAYLGYLYPPRFFFMLPSWAGDSHRHRVPIRGRGVALLLGLLAAVTTVAGAPAWMGWLALGIWGIVAGITGYASAATLATATSFAILLQFLPLSAGSRLLVIGVLALVFWRFKENIGRMLEVVEPKLGDAPPIGGQKASQAVAAFIIHPLYIDGFWKSRRFGLLRWLYGRGILTDGFLTEMGKRVRPIKIGELRGIYTKAGVEIRCHIITAPLMPEVFKSNPELAKLRAIQGARLAQELGASVYGLGAFFGTVAKKGLEVQEAVPEVHVTNGGAYTAGTIRAAVPEIIRHQRLLGRDPRSLTAAVVGANGVVAFGMARMIAAEVGTVILIGRDLARLERSKQTLQRAYPQTEFRCSLDPHDCIEADLVFCATSDPNPVVFARDVKPGAWIYDEGRPADVAEEVLAVPGVRLIPGGVVRPPGHMFDAAGWAKGLLGFGDGYVPACLAETLIIAANQSWERVSLGDVTKTENIQYFIDEADKLGFVVIDEAGSTHSLG